MGACWLWGLALGACRFCSRPSRQAIDLGSKSYDPYPLALALYVESRFFGYLKEFGRAEAAAAQALALSKEHGFGQVLQYARLDMGWARATGVCERRGVYDQSRFGWLGRDRSTHRPLRFPHSVGRSTSTRRQDRYCANYDREGTSNEPRGSRFPSQRSDLSRRNPAQAQPSRLGRIRLSWRDRTRQIHERQILGTALDHLASRDSSPTPTAATEALTLLSSIYNWFTEGFDTADLKDAKTLLDELSA